MRYWAQQAVELCAELDDESLEPLKDAVLESVETMGQDRRVVVLGASGSGKSALLAGMVGAPVLGKVSFAHHFLRWRYLNDDDDFTHCRFLPNANLAGMELVDTHGCEEPAVRDAVLELLPGADVVVAVVDVRTLQDSPVWEMLATLPGEGGPACLLVLTFADTLDAAASISLNETARQLCRERLNRVLPLYLVNALQPKQMDELGDKVVAAMESAGSAFRSAIREVMKRGDELLRKQGSILKARDAVARTDSGFLQGIELEIDGFQTRQMQGVRNCVLNYSSSSQRGMPRLLQHLRHSLGFCLSPVVLLRLECYASAVENLYYRLILDDVTLQQEELDKQFVHSCNGHWRSVRPRMKQTLQCEIGDFPAAELEKELEQLRQRLQVSLYEPFRALRLRSRFTSMFKCQVEWMRFFITCVCLSLTVAGLLGFFSLESLAYIFLGVSAAFWLLGSLIHCLVVRKICKLVRREAEPLREELTVHMQPQVQDMIVSRVAAYRRLYTNPRRRVAEYETTLEPLQKRQNEIMRQLRSAAPHV